MTNSFFRACSKRSLLILALVLISAGSALAQESPFTAAMKTNLIEPNMADPNLAAPNLAEAATPSPYVQASYVHTTEFKDREHHFWDRDNAILFTTVGAAAAADFCVTRANLASGGRELNPVTRMFAGSTTGLAVNFIGETAGTIGISYFFHKTGHHKLERLTSFVDISMSAGAVGFGWMHR